MEYLILPLGMLVAIIWSLAWACNDAEKRGKGGCLVAFLVFLTWSLGLFIWVVFRPVLPEDSKEK